MVSLISSTPVNNGRVEYCNFNAYMVYAVTNYTILQVNISNIVLNRLESKENRINACFSKRLYHINFCFCRFMHKVTSLIKLSLTCGITGVLEDDYTYMVMTFEGVMATFLTEMFKIWLELYKTISIFRIRYTCQDFESLSRKLKLSKAALL